MNRARQLPDASIGLSSLYYKFCMIITQEK